MSRALGRRTKGRHRRRRPPLTLTSVAREQRRARRELLVRATSVSRLAVLALTALVLIEGAVGVAMPIASGRLVGALPRALDAGVTGGVGRAFGVLAGVYAVSAVAPSVRVVLATWVGSRIDQQVRLDLMMRMLEPPGVSHVEDPSVRDAVTRASGVSSYTPGGVIAGLSSIAASRLASIGAVAVIATFRWWLALGLLLLAINTEAKARRDYLHTAQVVSRNTGALRHAEYAHGLVLSGVAAKELRVFGLADWLEQRFTQHWLQGMTEAWRDRRARQGRVRWADPLRLICTVGAYVGVAYAAGTGEIGLARTITLLAAISGVRGFINVGPDRSRVEYGVASYLAFTDVDRSIRAHETAYGTADPSGMPRKEIRFENVSFHYPGTDRDVLRKLNLVIPAGTSLGVVGLNGAGKSTLAKLLARCYEPTEGRITIDGIDLRDLDPELWQRRVAAVFQDFVTAPLSLRDNVTFGALHRVADASALAQAVRRAGLHDLIDRLPHGCETVLSKTYGRGVDLSGGEAQRVALARALFAVEGGATLLLLDEPTSALDVRTEADLFDRYLELTRGVTSVVISHRFSTVRRADLICVIDDGRVVELGSHDELVARDGGYARMFKLQAARFAEPVGSDG